MQAIDKATLNEYIQQYFQQQSHLAIQLIMSLDDLSLRNMYFAELMTEFTAAANGYSRNVKQLTLLNEMQLYTLQQFLYYIQQQCPTCYTQHVQTGLKTIHTLLQPSQLVS